jgi:hypothetical protein
VIGIWEKNGSMVGLHARFCRLESIRLLIHCHYKWLNICIQHFNVPFLDRLHFLKLQWMGVSLLALPRTLGSHEVGRFGSSQSTEIIYISAYLYDYSLSSYYASTIANDKLQHVNYRWAQWLHWQRIPWLDLARRLPTARYQPDPCLIEKWCPVTIQVEFKSINVYIH